MNILAINNNTYPVQDQRITANIISNSDAHTQPIASSVIDDVSHIAKEAAISAIPIYGTIQSFKKGEIGWGIFGIITDILTIMPVIGFSTRFAGSLIKGSSIAIKVGTTAAAETMKVADVAIKGSQVATKVEAIIQSSKIEAEIAKKIAKENDPAKYYGKKFIVQVVRSTDPGLEMLYKTSKYLYGKGGEFGEKLGNKLIGNK